MDGRSWRIVALALLVAAIGAAAYGVSAGLMEFALLIVFPVLYGSSGFVLVPALLLFGAFGAWFAANVSDARAAAGADAGAYRGERPEWAPREDEDWTVRSGARHETAERALPERERGRAKWGGVVLLGPIPVAFGNDRRLLVVLVTLALLLVVASLAASFLL